MSTESITTGNILYCISTLPNVFCHGTVAWKAQASQNQNYSMLMIIGVFLIGVNEKRVRRADSVSLKCPSASSRKLNHLQTINHSTVQEYIAVSQQLWDGFECLCSQQGNYTLHRYLVNSSFRSLATLWTPQKQPPPIHNPETLLCLTLLINKLICAGNEVSGVKRVFSQSRWGRYDIESANKSGLNLC